ncbi:beta,beta-carotene 15,15'-dioxygenase [Clupea harengus]|uniref:Beta,beta-carotene 15,15'-dioxygenase n=1 Tax=Clupea harengus TaxID=7950 RepID=A0A6P8FP40_CLUHA|nr:beta,beta-carotene 15,15'-dioxygenase [Clupea harengus]
MEYDYGKNKEESPEPAEADIAGTLPDWLQGTLVRTGPGIFSVGETSYNHWFDGMALMHSFTIKDGGVSYKSRYLQGDTYKANMEAKRIVVSEMGTMAYPDPRKNIFSKVITFLNHAVPDFTDNCGNNIIRYGNDFYATSETNYIRKIDPVTLETLGKVDYLKYLPLNLVTSHPHYDKEGNTYNMGTSIADKAKSKYIIFKVPAATKEEDAAPALKNLEVICSIPCRSLLTPSYYHSFAMTDNYFIFIEQPFKLDILKMATAYMRGVNWASCMKFHPEENTLIHLIDRRTKKEVVTKYYTDSMVVYHHVNAFEEDDHVVFDVIAYDDDSLYDMFYLDKLNKKNGNLGSSNKAYSSPKCKRFALPLTDKGSEVGADLVKLKYTTASAVKEKDGKVLCQPEVLCGDVEVPRINYDYNGKKHRFVYMTKVGMSAVATKIIKLDVETKKKQEWTAENCWPSEAVFISRPNAVEEDDGVILTSVINATPGELGFLLVLDAKTFKEIARARVKAELHMDMHGHFIPQSS